MKKLVVIALVFSMMTVALFGCSMTGNFSGEWNFSKIAKVEFAPELSEDSMANLKTLYNAEDEAGILENALAAFNEDGTFAPYYIKFGSPYTYSYDPLIPGREATWVFYSTGENEGFVSFYTELDAAEGNPDPVGNPNLVYNPESGTMQAVLGYSAFMVTVELTKK